MEEKKYEAIVEAILFTMGESVELERIAKTLEQRKRKDCSRKSRRGTVMISFLNKDSRIAVV